MINIVIDYDDHSIEIENDRYPAPEDKDTLFRMITILSKVLDAAKYSGEAVCLETKNDGFYTEVSRW